MLWLIVDNRSYIKRDLHGSILAARLGRTAKIERVNVKTIDCQNRLAFYFRRAATSSMRRGDLKLTV